MTPPRRPQVDSQQARQLVEDHYGLAVNARELPAYDDRNFLLEDSSGERSVLKISTADCHSAVEMQTSLLNHLEKRSLPFQVPRVHPSLGGAPLVRIADDTGEPCTLRRLSFVAGRHMEELGQYGEDFLLAFGRALGQLDVALSNFRDPVVHRDLEWDLRHAGEARHHLAAIPIAEDRALAAFFLDQFRRLAEPRLADLRRTMIHSDANPQNVLVDERGELAGFIDFGDLMNSCLVCEPAVAAAYAMIAQAEPLATASQLIAGYHGVWPLSEEEIAVLYPMLCARLSVSVTLGARERQREPDNPHLGTSSPATWTLLRRLREVTPRQAEETFREACGL